MSETPQTAASGPSHRWVEMGVALLMVAFALIVIAGSIRAGHDWAFDGPRAGFFPFYVGLFILAASIINFVQAWMAPAPDKLFADWPQLRQVVSVVIPAAIYVALVPWVGIYVASVVLIALFMKWLGSYGWGLVLTIACAVPLLTFIVFERWFLVPLPKGPLEEFLGF